MIKESTAITYEIRDDNGSHPVFVTINEDGETCHFSGSGDYGDYSYFWGSMGSEFKEFLSSLDYGYFMQKVTSQGETGWETDCQKSKNPLKIGLLSDYRRLLEMHPDDKETIREELEFIFEEIDSISYDFDNELYRKVNDNLSFFWDFFSDGTPFLISKRTSQCDGFWKQFQKLCDKWREELKESEK